MIEFQELLVRNDAGQSRVRKVDYYYGAVHLVTTTTFVHSKTGGRNLFFFLSMSLKYGDRQCWYVERLPHCAMQEEQRWSVKSGATDCCAKRILELQPDFQELVQEVIRVETAGHLCIFLLEE